MTEPLLAMQIDPPRRYSDSLIWRLLRRYYEQRGVSAWDAEAVPHYVTNHPFIAEAYARVVLGFLRDLARDPRRAGAGAGEPVHVVELGAGTGRFAFHFLRALVPAIERSALRGTRICYVLTDFSDATFAWWRAHPAFAPYLAAGQLDFARFDATADEALQLASGRAVAAGPLVAIANYVFDSLAQDAFAIRGGEIFDKLVAVHGDAGADASDPALLETMRLAFSEARAPEPRYGEPVLDALLAEYAALVGDGALAFPVEAIRCVRRLHRLAGGRLLLVAADRGYHRIEDVRAAGDPHPTSHGGPFSLAVNYHAIGRAVAALGGTALATSHAHAVLDLCAFVTGVPDAGETALAFTEALERISPDDFYAVRKALEPHHGAASLEQLLALVRLSGYDATVFGRALPVIRAYLPHAEDQHAELARVTREVWTRYFRLPSERELVVEMGLVFFDLGRWADALELFEAADAADLAAECRAHLGA